MTPLRTQRVILNLMVLRILELVSFSSLLSRATHHSGLANDFGSGKNNITATGSFTTVPYAYNLTPLVDVRSVVTSGGGSRYLRMHCIAL
jgi:hypothetical protein